MGGGNERVFSGIPNSASELVKFGPLVAAVIRPDVLMQEALLGAGRHIGSCEVSMLVDTGASHSMLDQRVVRQLGLRPHKEKPFLVANNQVSNMMVYYASIALPMDRPGGFEMVIFEFQVASVPPGKNVVEHHGLIGREFLERFRLAYDGPRGRFALHTMIE